MSSALATAQSSLGVPVSVPQQGGNSGQQFVSYNGDTYLIQTGKVLQLVGWTYHIHSCQHEHVTQNLLLELIKKNPLYRLCFESEFSAKSFSTVPLWLKFPNFNKYI